MREEMRENNNKKKSSTRSSEENGEGADKEGKWQAKKSSLFRETLHFT